MRARRSTGARYIALCAIISAIGVLVLFLGSIVDVLDLSAAMMASILCAVVLIEMGKLWPWLTYAVISVLSLLLLPNKLPGFIFLLCGYYPIIKQKLERQKRFVAWIIKIVIFNFLCTVFLLSCSLFFPGYDTVLFSSVGKALSLAITYALGNFIFVLYDIALTKLITYYIFVLRDRLRIKK